MKPIDLHKNIIWPTCIFTVQWSEHSKYALDIQKNAERWAENNPQSTVAQNVKKGLYESTFDYLDQDEECISELRTFILGSLIEVGKHMNDGLWVKDQSYEINIVESWFHETKNQGYHDVHGHPMSSWSGIYYLNIGDSNLITKNGINRFYAPYHSMYSDRGNQYLTNVWDLEPHNGTLVLFPAHILHSALPYFGKTPRYVIAFNARIEDAR